MADYTRVQVVEHVKKGTVDVTVTDRWRLAKIAEIESHWKLALHDVRAEVPEGLTPLQRAKYSPWIRVLNKLGDAVLEFGLKFDGTQLTTLPSRSRCADSSMPQTQTIVSMPPRAAASRREPPP